MKAATHSRPRLGKHQAAILAFAARHPGPHSLTSNRSDPAHGALASLTRRGILCTILVGSSVMFQIADGSAPAAAVAVLP